MGMIVRKSDNDASQVKISDTDILPSDQKRRRKDALVVDDANVAVVEDKRDNQNGRDGHYGWVHRRLGLLNLGVGIVLRTTFLLVHNTSGTYRTGS